LGEVLDFMRLIWALDHRLRVESKRLQARRHLAYSHQLVLRIVGRFPSLSPGQLARILHVDPSTVSATLHHLSRRGLLQRSPDPRDGRRVQLGLTEKGRALDVPLADSVEAVVGRTMGRQPEGRVAAARQVLESLVVALRTSHGG
jgi:DNA-binding MarR family transcriptional regulator